MTHEQQPVAAIADNLETVGDNERMAALIAEEQATAADVAWWEKSPWGGKNWDLYEIALYKLDYEETQNPVFALLALEISLRLTGLPPDVVTQWTQWAKDYFQLSLQQFVQLVGATNPPSRDVGNAIAETFGFRFDRGKGSPLSQAPRRLRDHQLALNVLRRLPQERGKETRAIEYVAEEFGTGVSIVGEAWRRFKRSLQNL